jgi:7-cyano-7-deazaguanine synthase
MEKVLILLSGGLDSCVLLSLLHHEHKQPVALSFHYGQRHACELSSAKKIAEHYQIPHTIINIDPKLFSNSSSFLVTSPYLASSSKNTCVPGRNMLFLSHAACVAASCGISSIYFAANKDDAINYPDCRKLFIENAQKSLQSSFEKTDTPIQIVCPFLEMTKKQIVLLGKTLNSPIDLSWSCYSPREETPCGTCHACILREDALHHPLTSADQTLKPMTKFAKR